MTLTPDLRFGVLGPLEVRRGEERLAIGGAKKRTVLAALLLNSNRPVSSDRLIDTVWPTAPPKSAVANLQTYVAELRRGLPAGDARIHTRSNGYLISVGADELDCRTFGELVATAARMKAAQRPAEALGLLRQALALWRGDPLEDLPNSSIFDADIARLVESRLAATEDQLELLVALGHHTEAVAEARALLDRHPFRERAWRQLMLALHRGGRRAAALQAYVDLRTRLVEELGVEPGPELRDVHQAILTSDEAEISPPAIEIPHAMERPHPTPAQLPLDVSGFTGRERELAELRGRAGEGGQGPVVICAVDGVGGIGKTALAVHFAHEVVDSFPHGQLYANLRGFDPDQPSLAPEEVLGQFLRALGIDPQRIPDDPLERATLYRSAVAGKRLLIVLDNAVAPDQVRPLLPGSPTCLVLVTSRNSLAGLTAREGAARIALDILATGEAVTLLARIAGSRRVAAEPDAAKALVRLCGHLPLALRIAGERIAVRPRLTLAELAEELDGEHDRLDMLAADGDEMTAVRAVFWWSYRALEPTAARTFRLLGLHPGPEFGAPDAAALIGADLAATRRLLQTLASGHLLEETGHHRYRFHDLVRLYAAERAATEDTREDRDSARRRVLTWYLNTADAAGEALAPSRRRAAPEPPEPGSEPLTFATRDKALAWCEAERVNLVAAARQAADTGLPTIAWKLSIALWDFFYLRKHWSDWISTHRLGLAAARQADDSYGVAWIQTSIANAYWEVRRYPEALDAAQQALRIWRELGDAWCEGIVLHLLGGAYKGLQRFPEGVDHYRQALAVHNETGNLWGSGWTLTSLAAAYRELGRLGEALDTAHEAKDVWQKLGDRHGEGIILNNLGDICRKLGQTDDAIRHFRQALEVNREIGNRWGEAWALNSIGKTLHSIGRLGDARTHWRQALAIFDDLDDPRAAEVRTHLGGR
ncbi:MAG: AfsR/SARP family transcriptional regulator [Actinomadura sp.]